MSIKIITDSTCDISISDAAKLDVELIPLKVNFGNEEYIDKFTITNEEFYKKLAESKVVPTTTLINPQQVTDVYEKFKNDDIVGIFISPKLSGSYQSAVLAKETSGRGNIYLVDSKSVTIGAALLVDMAVQYRKEGYTAQEIYEKLVLLAQKVEIFAVIDTLKYLVLGGRLSGVQGVLGGILGIKPIIRVKDGVVESIGKERGTKRALAFLFAQIHKEGKISTTLPVAYGHTNDPDDLIDLIARFGRAGNVYSIGSVVGTHAGPGAIAVAYFKE